MELEGKSEYVLGTGLHPKGWLGLGSFLKGR